VIVLAAINKVNDLGAGIRRKNIELFFLIDVVHGVTVVDKGAFQSITGTDESVTSFL